MLASPPLCSTWRVFFGFGLFWVASALRWLFEGLFRPVFSSQSLFCCFLACQHWRFPELVPSVPDSAFGDWVVASPFISGSRTIKKRVEVSSRRYDRKRRLHPVFSVAVWTSRHRPASSLDDSLVHRRVGPPHLQGVGDCIWLRVGPYHTPLRLPW